MAPFFVTSIYNDKIYNLVIFNTNVRWDYNQRNLDYAVWGPQCSATMQCGDHSAAPLCSVGTTVQRHYAVWGPQCGATMPVTGDAINSS